MRMSPEGRGLTQRPRVEEARGTLDSQEIVEGTGNMEKDWEQVRPQEMCTRRSPHACLVQDLGSSR